MAIDPTAPLTPITPAAPSGSQPNTVVLQAVARAALANSANALGHVAGRPAADAAKPRQGVEQTDKAPTQDGGRSAGSSALGGGVLNPSAPRAPPQETRLMRAVRLAATDAASRQAGLAPLMADVLAVMDRADAPPDVRAAGESLLARLPRDFEMSTARGLKRAVEQSGVFLEARLAKSASSAAGGHALPASSRADLKAALLVFRGALNHWLARAASPADDEPSHAEIVVERIERPVDVDRPAGEATPPPQTSPRPEPEDGAGEVLATEEGASESLDGDGGAQISARLSPPSVDRECEASPARPADVQPTEPQEEGVEPRFAAFLASSKPAPMIQSANPVSAALGLLGLAEISPLSEEGPALPIAAAPLAARGYGGAAIDPATQRTPPPPFADGPMAGQRPAVSDLPAYATPDEIVRRLLNGASAALARQDLMQIASLREVHHDPEAGEARPQPARLNLDVPFVTPQGVAVAQFEITKDGGGQAGAAFGPTERSYRVRFSIDVEPLGPVHVLATLAGSRARVSFWADRAETIARIRAGEEILGAALRQAELRPEISVHSGPPPVKDGRALGHFVDQAS